MEATCLKSSIKILLWVMLSISFSGCYFRATITPAENDLPEASLSKTATHEIASGAHAYITTPSSYKVRHSVGFNVPKQKYTTPTGYQVYNHVQGILTSDEVR